MIGIMFLIMILMIFAGVPVAFSILGSGIFFLLETGMKPLTLVCQRAVTGLDSFPLLAVPLFVFVGDSFQTIYPKTAPDFPTRPYNRN